MSKRVLAVSLCLVVGLSLTPSPSFATPPSRERVRELLSGFEGGASQEAWAALGVEALPVIIEVYNTTSEPPFVRIRAVSASANFPSEATRTFLRTVATQAGQNELIVREAVSALVRAFGASAEQDVLPFLSHASATVRVSAVRALSSLHSASATQALQARMRVERESSVREALRRSLSH